MAESVSGWTMRHPKNCQARAMLPRLRVMLPCLRDLSDWEHKARTSAAVDRRDRSNVHIGNALPKLEQSVILAVETGRRLRAMQATATQAS